MVLSMYGLSASAAGGQYALKFPKNGDSPSTAYVAIHKLNAHNDGLPIWGPSNAGVTVIRRCYLYQQTGYYQGFWYSGSLGNDTGCYFDENHYWGFHPFPVGSPGVDGTDHVWEIGGSNGAAIGDWTHYRNSESTIAVTKGRWYIQALRVQYNGNTTKTITGYFDLPSTADNTIIDTVTASAYGDSAFPGGQYGSPAVTIGDSPWFGTNQHERFSGLLSHQMIFASILSEADMLTEAANLSQPGAVTTAGQDSLWWHKKGFTGVDDLTCSVTGRTFVWADTNNKGTIEAL